MDQELVYELTARNCDGEVLDVDVKSLFHFRLLDYPEDYTPKLKVRTKDQPVGTIGIVFIADKPSTYVLKIEYGEEDIQGSPFAIVVTDKVESQSVKGMLSFDLPVICHYAGCFNQHTREFMVKPNVMGNTVYCFDLKKNPTRTFDLPVAAWSLCTDSDGNIYCGDNKKNFFKFTGNLKQIWTTQVEEKFANGVFCDGTHLYALIHKGPILRLDMHDGSIIEKITPTTPFKNAFNLVFHKNFFMIGDMKEMLIYDTKGNLIRPISGFESCAFAILDDNTLYFCNNKSTKWNVLEL